MGLIDAGVDKAIRYVFATGFSVHFRINSPKVIHQIFDSEVVIVNLDSGNYYSIRGSGIDIWRHIASEHSREEIAAMFEAAEAAGEVKSFFAELEREQLIVPVEDEANTQEKVKPLAPISFITPKIDKFTDMRDLLLLDPIHELDESGWPRNRLADEEK